MEAIRKEQMKLEENKKNQARKLERIEIVNFNNQYHYSQ